MSKPDDEQTAGAFRGVAVITLIAIGAAALLAFTNEVTRDRIAANEIKALQKGLNAILPAGKYDNQPHFDIYYALAPDLLGTAEKTPVYRARQSGQPVAAVLSVFAPDGYVGQIKLLVSVNYAGEIIAVRAVQHSETPGLGDAIDTEKSTWITQFIGRSLTPDADLIWRVRRDGGEIDQITGATVTSRTVVKAVRDALHYFDANRDEIFGVEK